MKRITSTTFFVLILLFSMGGAHGELSVVVSIKPIHSLVSAVMQGSPRPVLIVQSGSSPHTFSMKPSQAAILGNAELVFWVGAGLEFFLKKPVKTIASNAFSVELIRVQGLSKWKFRREKDFETPIFGGHQEEGKNVSKNEHTNHEHDKFDPHIWLDPVNAKVLVHEIKRILVQVDPGNMKRYVLNAKATIAKLDRLLREVQKILLPVNKKGFLVFHDGYQYFEKRFGLFVAGSVTGTPGGAVGVGRLADIRAKLKKLGPTCVFTEPQFAPRLASLITEGTNAKLGMIDPLGLELKAGPELYFSVIRNIAVKIRNCLSGTQ